MPARLPRSGIVRGTDVKAASPDPRRLAISVEFLFSRRSFSRLLLSGPFALSLLGFGPQVAGPAAAQGPASGYPNRQVKLIVPFAAGGPTDAVARLIAQKLTEGLRHQFHVENQPGAGGNFGTGNAARAAPDGYTLLFTSAGYVVNPSLFAKVPYDPHKDFAPVTMVADAPNALIVNPALPSADAGELVALIRANPGRYSFASAGVGTTTHLSGERLKLALGLDLAHAPFGGARLMLQSLVGGRPPIAFIAVPSALSAIREGKVRPLAVLSRTRSSALPDVPTMEEAGFKDQDGYNFQGLLAPAGTPRPIIDLLHREVVRIAKAPDLTARFGALGLDVVANTPEQFTALLDVEMAKWARVINDAKLKLQ
jgi:tripartite-type tricarboxylate transporter receptor subunit TctC